MAKKARKEISASPGVGKVIDPLGRKAHLQRKQVRLNWLCSFKPM